ncbi:MAG: HalOD1 output domain-containing protein [Salinirussus sp.]
MAVLQEPESLTESVVKAVARREGVEESELPPLYDAIDTEALDRLFRASGGSVTFEYNGYRISVDHDGEVTFRDGNSPTVAEPASAPAAR